MRKIINHTKKSKLSQNQKILSVFVIFNAVIIFCFIFAKEYTLLLMAFVINTIAILTIIVDFKKFSGEFSPNRVYTEMEK